MKITRLIERHSYGAFTVEDENGNQFFIQLAHKLEEAWQKQQEKEKDWKMKLRETEEWKALFAELQQLQNAHHPHQDILTITGFFKTLEELESHVDRNKTITTNH